MKYDGPERRHEIRHMCIHEVDWGALQKTLKSLERNQERMIDVLQGNGRTGLVTEAALNKQGLKRAWWWLGGISTAILGLAIAYFK